MDGDGRTDILLADKRRFVWYRNPTWERFVLAENLTRRDNVCIAAQDIDSASAAPSARTSFCCLIVNFPRIVWSAMQPDRRRISCGASDYPS